MELENNPWHEETENSLAKETLSRNKVDWATVDFFFFLEESSLVDCITEVDAFFRRVLVYELC